MPRQIFIRRPTVSTITPLSFDDFRKLALLSTICFFFLFLYESVNYQDVYSILTTTEPMLGGTISSWAFFSLPWWARPRKSLRSIVILACRRQRTDDSNRSRQTKPFAMTRQIVCISLVLMVDDLNRLVRIPTSLRYTTSTKCRGNAKRKPKTLTQARVKNCFDRTTTLYG